MKTAWNRDIGSCGDIYQGSSLDVQSQALRFRDSRVVSTDLVGVSSFSMRASGSEMVGIYGLFSLVVPDFSLREEREKGVTVTHP